MTDHRKSLMPGPYFSAPHPPLLTSLCGDSDVGRPGPCRTLSSPPGPHPPGARSSPVPTRSPRGDSHQRPLTPAGAPCRAGPVPGPTSRLRGPAGRCAGPGLALRSVSSRAHLCAHRGLCWLNPWTKSLGTETLLSWVFVPERWTHPGGTEARGSTTGSQGPPDTLDSALAAGTWDMGHGVQLRHGVLAHLHSGACPSRWHGLCAPQPRALSHSTDWMSVVTQGP